MRSPESGSKSILLRDPEQVAEFRFPGGAIDIDAASDCETYSRSGFPAPKAFGAGSRVYILYIQTPQQSEAITPAAEAAATTPI